MRTIRAPRGRDAASGSGGGAGLRGSGRALALGLLAAAAWAAPGWAAPAAAQEDGAAAEGAAADGGEARAQTERAREHMERGQELYVQSRFLEAAEEFQAAYEAQPFSAFLFNAGVAYERAGEAERAVGFFERYLQREPGAGDADDVRARIARLGREATAPDAGEGDGTGAEPGVDVPDTGTGAAAAERPAASARDMKSLLSIESKPEGAEVTLQQGGRIVAAGPAPFAHTLESGDYQIKVEHPDYETVERPVRIRPGRVYVVIVEMSQGQFLGYLRVLSNVPGASVYVDDRELGAMGQTPFANALEVGTHRVWIEKPGFEVIEREIELEVGGDQTLTVELERVSYGRLRVVSNVRGAKVYVDGEQVGVTPFEGQVDAGPREVRLSADGMKDWKEIVDVERGRETPVRVRLRPAPSRGGAWATTIIGLGFIGGGVALGLLANDREDALRADLGEGLLADDDGRLTEGWIFSIGANVAFGVGAILGILSIYYFVKDDLPDSEGVVLEPRDWALLPWFDRDGGGGAFQLHF